MKLLEHSILFDDDNRCREYRSINPVNRYLRADRSCFFLPGLTCKRMQH